MNWNGSTGPRIGSLCSGYGGLDLAVQAVLGGQAAWVADPDPSASAVLAARFAGVPNLADITAVDWAGIEPPDIVTAGFPCQDVSLAGTRQGLRAGTRSGLWTHVWRAVDALRPPLVLLENVRGLLSAEAGGDVESCPGCLGDRNGRALRALGAVLGNLAAIGYDAEWQVLRASYVGAPHRRERVFVLAWPAAAADPLGRGRHRRPRAPQRGQAGGTAARRDRDAPPAHPSGARRPQGQDPGAGPGRAAAGHRAPGAGLRPVEPQRGRRERAAHLSRRPPGGPAGGLVPPGGRARHAEQDGPGPDWGPYGPAIARWEAVTGRRAPSPVEPGRGGSGRLSPGFVEWMMGVRQGWVTGVPGLSRGRQLAVLGNGVVPQQASAALELLLGRAGLA